MKNPPLSLYVHLPWCVRKCPYCDFNSHAIKDDFPGDDYINLLLTDLEAELPLVWGRVVHSIFLGGGTPSLFSADQIERLVNGIRGRLPLSPDAEVTLEANPGTIEHDSFSAYRDAGINRISLGVQSFSDERLRAIGRIHGRAEVGKALDSLRTSGIANFNIDLMFALPGQSANEALEDVRMAVESRPAHLSHYQLTLEPNTAFFANPPDLPDDDEAWEMQSRCAELLAQEGYEQYEISAWARPGNECRHNLNYWGYGDFVGIGAGAHGKITMPSGQEIRRRIRLRHPRAWMQAVPAGSQLAEDRVLTPEERIFEFFLNQSRLRRGIEMARFTARTGLGREQVEGRIEQVIESGLLKEENGVLIHTALGWRFINEIQAIFLP
jgi:oxygen-independent coproporphyrinogen-3 oxidase